MDNDRKPSLADDPGFVASLKDLDRGMPAPFPVPTPAAPAPPQAARRAPERPTTYQTFYGFNEAPFNRTASDLKFLYQSAAYDQAAQAMLGAIARRDGIVVLTGPIGIGKTMLCRAVIDQLDSRTVISFVDEPFQSLEQLLKKVLVDFGVVSRAEATAGRFRNANRHQLSTALRAFLSSLAPLQAFAVVFIDEAQNLRRDLLEQVRVLVESEGDERVLQVVLVGQPPLLRALKRRELRPLTQRIAVRCTLGPLAADEIGGYVTHRLRTAGPNSRIDFDEPAARRLYELSRGNPLAVNLVCERALLIGYNTSASAIDDHLINAAAEAIGLAAPMTKAAAARLVAVIVLLVLLVVVGAVSAALIFRDDVAAVMQKWQRQTAAPR